MHEFLILDSWFLVRGSWLMGMAHGRQKGARLWSRSGAVVLGMWWDWRHADAGVGIGMILVKKDDYGYAKSFKKSVFTAFVFCRRNKKKRVFFTKTSRLRLCYYQAEGVGKIDSQFSRMKRSPEGLLHAKEGFEDELSYPKLKFGVEKVSF